MKRKIIQIDEKLCNGCGICVPSCHEGAIKIIDGKAKLVDDKFCDGLGDCLNECPLGAIKIIEREAAEYDEQAVNARLAAITEEQKSHKGCSGGCPGSANMFIANDESESADGLSAPSRLGQWPVQLHLLSPLVPFFDNRELIIVADCVAFAMGNFHEKYMKGRSVAIACPKLDDTSSYK